MKVFLLKLYIEILNLDNVDVCFGLFFMLFIYFMFILFDLNYILEIMNSGVEINNYRLGLKCVYEKNFVLVWLSFE